MNEGPFRLVVEFSSIESFTAFCAVLRGQPVDTAALQKLTNDLKPVTDSLAKSVAQNQPKK